VITIEQVILQKMVKVSFLLSVTWLQLSWLPFCCS